MRAAPVFLAVLLAGRPASAADGPLAGGGRMYHPPMHRSRLAGFIIDCNTQDLPAAAAFWSAALGIAPLKQEGGYVSLDGSKRDLAIEVQSVAHPSRVHLDIEADDVEAEVARLEGLGARRVQQIKTWWVLEAPTGQRFCVIRAKTDLRAQPTATAWE